MTWLDRSPRQAGRRGRFHEIEWSGLGSFPPAAIDATGSPGEWRTNGFPLLQSVADLIAILLPEMKRLAVATAPEVGVETLVERLRSEAVATAGVLFGHHQMGAWSRVLP